MRTAARWLPMLLALALLLWLTGDATACPNCKEALATQTGDAARLKDGYFFSILLMMAMPFFLLGAGGLFVYRAVRRGTLPEI